MSENKEHLSDLPRVELTTNELQVIDTVLTGMNSYFRATADLTPENVKRIRDLEALRQRVASLHKAGAGNTEMITAGDVHAILEAITSFIELTRLVVPPSAERNDTLQRLKLLRTYMEQQFYP